MPHRFEPLERRCLMAAGDRDLTFGDDGVVDSSASFGIHALPNDELLVNVGGRLDRLAADGSRVSMTTLTGGLEITTNPLPLPDGKFLAVGVTSETDPVLETSTYWYQLQRHNADGSLDASFGKAGKANELSATEAGMTYARQPDGRIIVSARDVLWRLTEDGDVDPTFPSRNFAASFHLWGGMFPQPNGKIIAFIALPSPAGITSILGLTKLNADGTTDTSFGDGGIVEVSQTTSDEARDIEVTPDGSILVSFNVVGEIRVKRYTADGDLDTNFGDGGTASVPLANVAQHNVAAVLHLLDDGDVLVPATIIRNNVAVGGSALVRLNADGSLDENFPRFTPATTYMVDSVITSSGKFVYAEDGTPGPGDDKDALARMLLDDTSDGPVTFSGGVLDVDGTDTPDRIRVTRFGDDLEVVRGDGLDRLVAVADVDLIDISALGGDDVVILAAGDIPSTVSGGDGHDRIAGGAGSDSLSGNAGNDRIDGGNGNDRVAGNGGRDKLAGGDGEDRLYGGNGGDWLAGHNGNDLLQGDTGDDALFARGDPALIDRVFGGTGIDAAEADDDRDLLDGVEDVLA